MKRIQNLIILAQCTGMLSHVLLQNNFILLYFLSLGMENSDALQLLALATILPAFLIIPCALLSDKFGKKKIGSPGNGLIPIGFSLLLVPVIAGGSIMIWLVGGLMIYSIGNAMHRSGWYALMDPAIPEKDRGKFFGKMRFSFMLTGVIFSTTAGVFLASSPTSAVYFIFLSITLIALIVRFFIYLRIPDLEPQSINNALLKDLKIVVAQLLHNKSYLKLNAYVFFITLLTDGAHSVFAIAEKEVMVLSDSIITHLGNTMIMGMLVGFMVSGYLTDRKGNSFVFQMCHVGYFSSLILFPALIYLFPGNLILLALVHFIYGFSRAGFSVAMTHEMFFVIPANFKSLSTTLTATTASIGGGFSLLASSWFIHNIAFSDTNYVSVFDIIILSMAWGLVILYFFRYNTNAYSQSNNT